MAAANYRKVSLRLVNSINSMTHWAQKSTKIGRPPDESTSTMTHIKTSRISYHHITNPHHVEDPDGKFYQNAARGHTYINPWCLVFERDSILAASQDLSCDRRGFKE